MPDTFIKIASVTVGSGGASSIAFTSIPATYTDLVIKLSARSARATNFDGTNITLNSSSSSMSYRDIEGDGSSAASYSASSSFIVVTNASSSTSNTFGNAEIYIPNYAGSNYKSISADYVGENNATAGNMGLVAFLWSNTAAINSISLSSATSNNYAQYSTATLYGISKS